MHQPNINFMEFTEQFDLPVYLLKSLLLQVGNTFQFLQMYFLHKNKTCNMSLQKTAVD